MWKIIGLKWIKYRNPNDIFCTNWNTSKKNTTTISEAYIKKRANPQSYSTTDLSIAAVLFHESHAHFFKVLFDDFHNNGDTCAYDNYGLLLYENM
jgi:hypothetical protein